MANSKREALRSLSESADAAYRGLVDYLETLQRKKGLTGTPFRMPVRSFDEARRDLAGTVASGNVKLGDEIVVLPSARLTKIKRITGSEGDLQNAEAGAEVVITLADQIEVATGDMLAAPQNRPSVADQFEAHLVWLSPEPLLPGRTYLMNINEGNVVATVTALKHHIDVATQAKLAAKTLNLGEIGVCNLSIARPVAFDAYADNRDTGAFILRDRGSNATIAAGMIDFAPPGDQHSSPDTNRGQDGSHEADAPSAVCSMVYRAACGGKIDYRQLGRRSTQCARCSLGHVGRRQCTARTEPRPRLHRSR